MAVTYSVNVKLRKLDFDEIDWDVDHRANFDIIDYLLTHMETITDVGGTVALVNTNGVTSTAKARVIKCTGALTSNLILTVPDGLEKHYTLWNATSGAFTVEIKTVSGTGITVTQSRIQDVYADGTNVIGISLEVDSSGDMEIVAAFPSEVPIIAYVDTVPTGWSQVTGLNFHAIRIVDTLGSGATTAGSRNFQDVFKENYSSENDGSGNTGPTTPGDTFAISGGVTAHALTLDENGPHNHVMANIWTNSGGVGIDSGSGFVSGSPATGVSGSGDPHPHADTFALSGTVSSHTHTTPNHSHDVDLGVKYGNFILIQRDA